MPGPRPGSTDSRRPVERFAARHRFAPPPWPFARADRPRSKWTHHEETRPIDSDSAHDAEASPDDRRNQVQPFQYAMLRVMPRVERGEAINAGVVLFCRPRRFLGARAELDAELLAALAPDCEPGEVREQLETLVAVADGRPEGGRVAGLPQSERFHWLTAPASTIVQPSEVHTGLTDDPAGELDKLFGQLVRRPL